MEKRNSNNGFDKAVRIAFKATLVGFIALIAVSLFVSFNKLWILVFAATGLLVCIGLILAKGAVTGKRYMQGAKHRRQKWLPMFFYKNESLADDAIQLWQEPQPNN